MEKKKIKISAIISLIAIVVLVAGATYAYFQAQAGEGKQTDINITTTTTDLLTFEVGDPLSFEVSMDNFSKGAGNVTGETFAQANLIANNKTNLATGTYNLYVLINSNQLKYSMADKKAELLLQVTDPSGNQVTSIDGLNYVTVTDAEGNSQSGFDVTVKRGLITVASDYNIESTSSTEMTSQKWVIKTIFVNHNADQTNNSGKGFYGKLIIQQETMDAPALADLCTEGQPFSECIINKADYDSTLYHHDGTIKDSSGNVIDAGDNSYRYSGASADVKNYVCLGSDTKKCPDDNLYRIIGVFNEENHGIAGQKLVKLIKSTSYGMFKWNSTQNNNWETSTLNTTLNTTFLTENLSGIADKISDVSWKISGYNESAVTPKVFCNGEITKATKTYVAKIGLMYASDYGFAAAKDYWTTTLYGYNNTAKSYDWLYIRSSEWTISISSSDTKYTWAVAGVGLIAGSGSAYVNSTTNTRPSFYLTSSVNFASGDGTLQNPYRIS